MIRLEKGPIFLDAGGRLYDAGILRESDARENSMARSILKSHSEGGDGTLHLRFDALVSPDTNYVSILQSAEAVGLERYPSPMC